VGARWCPFPGVCRCVALPLLLSGYWLRDRTRSRAAVGDLLMPVQRGARPVRFRPKPSRLGDAPRLVGERTFGLATRSANPRPPLSTRRSTTHSLPKDAVGCRSELVMWRGRAMGALRRGEREYTSAPTRTRRGTSTSTEVGLTDHGAERRLRWPQTNSDIPVTTREATPRTLCSGCAVAIVRRLSRSRPPEGDSTGPGAQRQERLDGRGHTGNDGSVATER